MTSIGIEGLGYDWDDVLDLAIDNSSAIVIKHRIVSEGKDDDTENQSKYSEAEEESKDYEKNDEKTRNEETKDEETQNEESQDEETKDEETECTEGKLLMNLLLGLVPNGLMGTKELDSEWKKMFSSLQSSIEKVYSLQSSVDKVYSLQKSLSKKVEKISDSLTLLSRPQRAIVCTIKNRKSKMKSEVSAIITFRIILPLR